MALGESVDLKDLNLKVPEIKKKGKEKILFLNFGPGCFRAWLMHLQK